MKLNDHFLVAMPSLKDTLFGGSVVYVTEHSMHSGAVGVIINKPITVTLKSALKKFSLLNQGSNWWANHVYLGGPFCAEDGFLLRQNSTVSGNSFELTNDKRALVDMINGEERKDQFLSMGYAAWNGLRLEFEIRRNNWLVVKADHRLILEVDPINRYSEAIRLLGINNKAQLYNIGDVIV